MRRFGIIALMLCGLLLPAASAPQPQALRSLLLISLTTRAVMVQPETKAAVVSLLSPAHLYSSLDLYPNGGRLPDAPEIDEETKEKLRSLG